MRDRDATGGQCSKRHEHRQPGNEDYTPSATRAQVETIQETAHESPVSKVFCQRIGLSDNTDNSARDGGPSV